MNIQEAYDIVENHQKWRRDNNVPSVYEASDPKKLGKALDVLLNIFEGISDMDKVQYNSFSDIKKIDIRNGRGEVLWQGAATKLSLCIRNEGQHLDLFVE